MEMKNETIKKLWRYERATWEEENCKRSMENEETNYFLSCRQKLCEALNYEQIKLLEEYEKACDSSTAIREQEIYTNGFKAGARIIFEGLYGDFQ